MTTFFNRLVKLRGAFVFLALGSFAPNSDASFAVMVDGVVVATDQGSGVKDTDTGMVRFIDAVGDHQIRLSVPDKPGLDGGEGSGAGDGGGAAGMALGGAGLGGSSAAPGSSGGAGLSNAPLGGRAGGGGSSNPAGPSGPSGSSGSSGPGEPGAPSGSDGGKIEPTAKVEPTDSLPPVSPVDPGPVGRLSDGPPAESPAAQAVVGDGLPPGEGAVFPNVNLVIGPEGVAEGEGTDPVIVNAPAPPSVVLAGAGAALLGLRSLRRRSAR